MRLAPAHKGDQVVELLREHITRPGDDTFGAKVEFSLVDVGEGFCAPDLPANVKEIVNSCCHRVHNKYPLYTGEGGSIPFMGIFAEHFPSASFLLVGICGLCNNAHAANEYLELEQCNKFTASLALILSKM